MIFFFAGVGSMGFIHWIMHRIDSGAQSPGIESSGAIEQFIQREAGQQGQQSLLPQRHSTSKSQLQQAPVPLHGDPPKAYTSGVPTPETHVCNDCMSDNSDGSEYVDDEVTSLLNNAFLQIGRTPNSCMDDSDHMQRHHTRSERLNHNDDDEDADNIEVVVTDQKGRTHRRAMNHHNNDVDMDLDLDQNQVDHTDRRKNSWSSASTRSLKPFAPANKKKRSNNVPKVKESQHNSNCHLAHTPAKSDLGSSHRQPVPTYGTIPPSVNRHHARHTSSFPHSEPATIRHTSFPRLKGSGTIYSRHDVLDHAVADDREHADLTEIGIQTALTIAIHKFPGNTTKVQLMLTTVNHTHDWDHECSSLLPHTS